MNRRELLECAAILISGISVSRAAFALSEKQNAFLAAAPHYNRQPVDYLTKTQRKIIAAMADIIIPATDTPGAIAAGVPSFIELMAADWFNDQERAIFNAGLAAMETSIAVEYGKSFERLSADQQLEIMQTMEAQASDSPWYAMGNTQREFISDAPFICQIKELTVWGFFTSEVGAKQALRYDPMPGHFEGDIPLQKNAASWAQS
jgi:hypothetical protein